MPPGAKARIDSVVLLPGINPWPTARMSFSAVCKARFLFVASAAPFGTAQGRLLKSRPFKSGRPTHSSETASPLANVLRSSFAHEDWTDSVGLCSPRSIACERNCLRCAADASGRASIADAFKSYGLDHAAGDGAGGAGAYTGGEARGGILYGLKQDDFVLEDNGVPQKIRVQEEMDTAPVALVVAVEEGGVSALEFEKLAKLGPLLDTFLSDSRSRAALVGFDSKPHLLVDYTHAGEDVDDALKHLEPGNGGAAILDTVSYAVDLLESEPKEYRRVLLLISEERDHGSKHTKPERLIEKIGRSDVLVLSVSFSPSRAELLHNLKDSGDNRTMNMMSPFVMLVQAFKKNAAKRLLT